MHNEPRPVVASVPHDPLTQHLFFLNHPATTTIYTLSLHDALPIFDAYRIWAKNWFGSCVGFSAQLAALVQRTTGERSEEHTSELQSRLHLVCRLLLEKKKTLLPPGTSSPAMRHDS